MPDQELRKDFDRFSQLKPPAKRAAYSDRTAWLMAILSQLAYTRFDAATDTEGFVAVRHADEDPGMAVVSFRGTQQVRDWMTNLKADKLAVRSDQPGISKTLGHVHKGFNQAFKSVEPQIHRCLRGVEDYPLYFTGHSLGGALATLATWYTAGKRQAARYTFGAPRVGDSRLLERFRTPIYRVVNGADPYPRLRNEYGIGSAQRLWRYCRQWFYNEVSARKRLVKYHDIAAYRDNQTMKRSFISSPLSLHHRQSLCTARPVCSGVLGMCGLISTPVSKCVVTRASADFRAGL